MDSTQEIIEFPAAIDMLKAIRNEAIRKEHHAAAKMVTAKIKSKALVLGDGFTKILGIKMIHDFPVVSYRNKSNAHRLEKMFFVGSTGRVTSSADRWSPMVEEKSEAILEVIGMVFK